MEAVLEMARRCAKRPSTGGILRGDCVWGEIERFFGAARELAGRAVLEVRE
jgi:hypothetical protein